MFSHARTEAEAGGRALLLTGDRDLFQAVDERARDPGAGKGSGPGSEIDPPEVRRRYGDHPRPGPRLHRPARRPVGRPARAPRASGRRRRATCCSTTARWTGAIAGALRERPRVAGGAARERRAAAHVPSHRHAGPRRGRRVPDRPHRLRRRRRRGARDWAWSASPRAASAWRPVPLRLRTAASAMPTVAWRASRPGPSCLLALVSEKCDLASGNVISLRSASVSLRRALERAIAPNHVHGKRTVRDAARQMLSSAVSSTRLSDVAASPVVARAMHVARAPARRTQVRDRRADIFRA